MVTTFAGRSLPRTIQQHRRARLGEAAVDVAHGERAVDGRAEATGGDGADRLAVGRLHDRALARGRPPVGQDADAQARRAFGEFLLDAGGAREAAFRAAALLDRPGQASLDRRRGGVDVVAVEAEPGLEAQAVAGAEADRLHARIGQKLLRQGNGIGALHRDLDAVLARVAGARDMGPDAVDGEVERGHELQAREFGRQGGDGGDRLRPLHRDEGEVVCNLERDAGRQMRPHMGVVGILAGGVHHQIEPVLVARMAKAGDHQILENAAFGIGELRIALLAGLQRQHIGRHELLEGRSGRLELAVGGDEEALAHVADVEQAGMFARPVVLGQNTGRVLHRHVITGEGHHLGAKLDMQGMKRGLQQGSGRGLAHRSCTPARERVRASRTRPKRGLVARSRPSVAGPERFTLGSVRAGTRKRMPSAYSVGGPGLDLRPLSRMPFHRRSFLPERFRGRCSFGAGRSHHVRPPGLSRRVHMARLRNGGCMRRSQGEPVGRTARRSGSTRPVAGHGIGAVAVRAYGAAAEPEHYHGPKERQRKEKAKRHGQQVGAVGHPRR